MEAIILDGALLTERTAAMDILTETLSLPEWWGRNLDALYDCLTDCDPPRHLTLRNRAALGELLDAYGVIRLENRCLPIRRDGAQIIVAGAEDPNGRADMIKPDALAELLRQEYPGEFVLWLGHRNYWAEKYPELPVDLILSGHAHGGIVRLPGIGGLLNVNHSFGAEYESGVYQGERFQMLVSRGLGNSIPVPRFLNRPELVKIILHCGQS